MGMESDFVLVIGCVTVFYIVCFLGFLELCLITRHRFTNVMFYQVKSCLENCHRESLVLVEESSV